MSLLNTLSVLLTSDFFRKTAAQLHESEHNVAKGIGAVVPMIVGACADTTRDTGSLTVLSKLLGDSRNEQAASSFGGLLSSYNNSEQVELGSTVAHTLFGENFHGVIQAVSGYCNVSETSAHSLVSLGSTMVVGQLGEVARSQQFDNDALARYIQNEESGVTAMLPTNFGAALSQLGIPGAALFAQATGTGNGVAAQALQGVTAATQAGTTATTVASADAFSWLIPVAGIAALIAGVVFLAKSCGTVASTAPTTTATQDTTMQILADAEAPRVLSTTGMDLGTMGTVSLPGGASLNIPSNGIESQLLAFIQDSTKQIDKTTWFNFDRLLFETGKSTLKSESAEQVSNITSILKAFPAVHLKIGGYTDNVGNAASNVTLSGARAKALVTELVKGGVEAARLESEGYGQEHPVASNDTEEGRAQNRRVAARVTKK